ncbi:ankyrin repeat domain-containing protein, partial [Kistimonas scapharcae]|uniref:ankyrin repeat domain-containing protein n=1 Tax=Kistimonas scapharcae TaxID=1036133 RepID=UPI0031E702A0
NSETGKYYRIRLMLAAMWSAQEFLSTYGYTPLLFLAEKNDYDTIDFLIMHGADPRQSQSSLTTPLHVACKNNNRELIDLFSDFTNLVVSQNVDGDTPLHLVLKQKNDKMDRWVRLLINSGADINKANNAGETPKMLMHGIYDEKGFPIAYSGLLEHRFWST